MNPLSLEVSANRLVGNIAATHWWRIGAVLGAISFKGIGDQVDFDFRAVASSFFIHAAHRGQSDCGEDRDDGDDDEEFDQREGGEAAVAGGEWLVAGIGGALRARRRSEIEDRR